MLSILLTSFDFETFWVANKLKYMKWYKTPLAIWGVILLLLGFILNIMMFSMIWPSTYLFFAMMTIGFVFIVVSLIVERTHLKRIDKLIVQLILIPTPIIFFWFLYIGKLAESEKYLIPVGYTGRVFVFHSHNYGSETEYENDFRVYRITDEGVLKTKFSENKGMIPLENLQFYYIDTIGNRHSIPFEFGTTNDSDNVYVFGRSFGEFGGITYQEFIIDTLLNAKYYHNVRTREWIRMIKKHDLVDLHLETAWNIIDNY